MLKKILRDPSRMKKTSDRVFARLKQVVFPSVQRQSSSGVNLAGLGAPAARGPAGREGFSLVFLLDPGFGKVTRSSRCVEGRGGQVSPGNLSWGGDRKDGDMNHSEDFKGGSSPPKGRRSSSG